MVQDDVFPIFWNLGKPGPGGFVWREVDSRRSCRRAQPPICMKIPIWSILGQMSIIYIYIIFVHFEGRKGNMCGLLE